MAQTTSTRTQDLDAHGSSKAPKWPLVVLVLLLPFLRSISIGFNDSARAPPSAG